MSPRNRETQRGDCREAPHDTHTLRDRYCEGADLRAADPCDGEGTVRFLGGPCYPAREKSASNRGRKAILRYHAGRERKRDGCEACVLLSEECRHIRADASCYDHAFRSGDG